MIDILVYLFEHYPPDGCPTPEILARKLSAAGFEHDDIRAALSWLEGLAGEGEMLQVAPAATSRRVFGEHETARLPAECRGFITFLEQHGAIDAGLREAIIDRALALPDAEIALPRLKVIVLAVLWRRQCEIEALILEELLADDGEDREFDPALDERPPLH